MADLKVTLSGWELDNPLIPASGTFGYGYEFAEIYDIRPKLAAHAVGMSSMLSAAAIPAVLALTRLIISL